MVRKLHAGLRGGPNLDSVRLEVEEKLIFTPFLTCPNLPEPVRTCPQYSDHARLLHNVIFCTFKCSYSSVLRPILVKIHIRTRLIENFPMTYRWRWCAEEKLHFTPVHTLRQLKHDEGLFPPLWRVVEFQAMYRRIPVRGFWRG